LRLSPSLQMSGKARSIARWMRALMQSWQSHSWFRICSKRSRLDWEDDRLPWTCIYLKYGAKPSIDWYTAPDASPDALSKHPCVVQESQNVSIPPISSSFSIRNFVSTDCNVCANARCPAIVRGRNPCRKRSDCIWIGWFDRSCIADECHKIPKLDATVLPDGSLEPDEDNIWHAGSLEVEKEVYRRLHGVKSLANCLNISKNGLELEYYRNGDLEDYIKNSSPAPWTQKLDWILRLVDFVAACHDKRVLWFDIALRNILLADDWSIRAIDFANSTAEPLAMRRTLMVIHRKWKYYISSMLFIPSLAGTSFRLIVWEKRNGRRWIASQLHRILYLVRLSRRLGSMSMTMYWNCVMRYTVFTTNYENDNTVYITNTE
jgi:hypothetical protein